MGYGLRVDALVRRERAPRSSKPGRRRRNLREASRFVSFGAHYLRRAGIFGSSRPAYARSARRSASEPGRVQKQALLQRSMVDRARGPIPGDGLLPSRLMRRLVVLQHAPHEGPSRVRSAFERAGFSVEIKHLYLGVPVPETTDGTDALL